MIWELMFNPRIHPKTIKIQPGAPSGRQGAPEVAQNQIFYGFGHPLDLLWAHFGYNFLEKLSETTATNTRILLEQISTNTSKSVPACCKCVCVFELQKLPREASLLLHGTGRHTTSTVITIL